MKSSHFQQHGQPRGYYAKWNKPDRERQILYDFTYMWKLKTKQMNKHNKRVIDTENQQVVVRGGWGRKEINEGD